jgi:hypothetical protein
MPLTSWATPVIQWLGQSEAISRELANLLNLNLSSDCRLQLACMKPELLVIASQPYGGEYVPGPCTHRPSHRERRSLAKWPSLTCKGEQLRPRGF